MNLESTDKELVRTFYLDCLQRQLKWNCLELSAASDNDNGNDDVVVVSASTQLKYLLALKPTLISSVRVDGEWCELVGKSIKVILEDETSSEEQKSALFQAVIERLYRGVINTDTLPTHLTVSSMYLLLPLMTCVRPTSSTTSSLISILQVVTTSMNAAIKRKAYTLLHTLLHLPSCLGPIELQLCISMAWVGIWDRADLIATRSFEILSEFGMLSMLVPPIERQELFFPEKRRIHIWRSTSVHATSPFTSLMAFFEKSHIEDCREIFWVQNAPATLSYVGQLYWIVWDAALEIVEGRLKTCFGGAAATFDRLENIIKDQITFLNDKEMDYSKNSTNPWLKSRLVLDLMAALERYIACAQSPIVDIPSTYTGQLISNPSFSEVTRTFYSTNARVCTDWFKRLRPHLFALSDAIKAQSLLFEHGIKIIHELRSNLFVILKSKKITTRSEIMITVHALDTSLWKLCEPLCEAKEVDTLASIAAWSSEWISKAYTFLNMSPDTLYSLWLIGLQKESTGSLEESTRCYFQILSSLWNVPGGVDLISCTTVTGILNRCINGYLSLGDDEQLASLSTVLEKARRQIHACLFSNQDEKNTWLLAITPRIPIKFWSVSSRQVEEVSRIKQDDFSLQIPLNSVQGCISNLERCVLLKTTTKMSASSVEKSNRIYRHLLQLQSLEGECEEHLPMQLLPSLRRMNTKTSKNSTTTDSSSMVQSIAATWTTKRPVLGTWLNSLEVNVPLGRKLMRLACEQGNFSFALRLLHDIQGKAKVEAASYSSMNAMLWDMEAVRLQVLKSNFASSAVVQLWQGIQPFVTDVEMFAGHGAGTEHVVDLLVDMSNMIQKHMEHLVVQPEMWHFVMETKGTRTTEMDQAVCRLHLENIAGQCIHSATKLSPTSPTVWWTHGVWCDSQVRRRANMETVHLSAGESAIAMSLVRDSKGLLEEDQVKLWLESMCSIGSALFSSTLCRQKPVLVNNPELLRHCVHCKMLFRKDVLPFIDKL